MTDLQEKAMRMALEILETDQSQLHWQAVRTLRQALAQPEQEPYGWISNEDGWFRKHEIADLAFKADAIPLYTAPPNKEWVGLTDQEIKEYKWMGQDVIAIVEEVQATLKDKNT